MFINTFHEIEDPLFNAVFIPNLSENTIKGLQISDADLSEYTTKGLQISDADLSEYTIKGLQISDADLSEYTTKSLQKGKAEITNISGRKNQIAVGKPYCRNLNEIFEEEKKVIPDAVKDLNNNYDFYLVVLSCSLLPDPDCKFIWTRFGVELNAYTDGKRLKEKPIAYDMYPDEVLKEIKIKNDFSFTGNFKIDLGVLNNENELKITDSKEYIHYEPEITAFGYGTSTVAWDFKATSGKDVSGNKRNLMIVVQTPKNSSIKGRIIIGAEIKTNNIFVPLKRIDDLIDVEYPLSK